MTGSKSHSKLVAESGLEFSFESWPLLAEFQPEAMLEASALRDPTSAWLAAAACVPQDPAPHHSAFGHMQPGAQPFLLGCCSCPLWGGGTGSPGSAFPWQSRVNRAQVQGNGKNSNDSWTQKSCLCQEAGSPKSRGSRGAEGNGVRPAEGAGFRGSHQRGDPQNSPHGLGDQGGWMYNTRRRAGHLVATSAHRGLPVECSRTSPAATHSSS